MIELQIYLSFSIGVLLLLQLTQQFNPSNYLFDLKHADFASIKAELNTINWVDFLNSCPDINSTWVTFSATLYAAIYRHCPRRKATNLLKSSLRRNILTLMHCFATSQILLHPTN